CLGFTALFSIFSCRLIYLQMIKHDVYAEMAAEKHVLKQKIYAERGTIFDTNSDVLARNVPVETLVADASLVNDRSAVVDLVSRELKIPAGEIAEKLATDRRYIVLKREVAKNDADRLREKWKALDLRGLNFEPDSMRIYPNNSMLCHVIGFT